MTGTTDGASRPIRVLVVEDDPVAADAHQLYVGRVPGFEVAGVAHSGSRRDAPWSVRTWI